MGKTVIKSEHKKILNKIRELYIQSGGKPLYEPEDFGLNDLLKSGSGMEVDFDYGVPHYLYTPDGSYMILGSNVVGDTKKFWELFNQEFEVEIIKPKRNDAEVSELEFQLQISGPVIRIREKDENKESKTGCPVCLQEVDTYKDEGVVKIENHNYRDSDLQCPGSGDELYRYP